MSHTRNISCVFTASEDVALLTLTAPFCRCFINLVSRVFLTFSFMSGFGNVSQKDKNKLQRVVDINSKIAAFKQSSLIALYEKQVLRKANKIIYDNIHNEYVLLPSSRRFRTMISKTNRIRYSFIPMSTTSTADVM